MFQLRISDFKKIIEENYYYFDKTNLIENILNDGAEVKLFTRPRKFGKTLNMSMLKYFFDIKNKDENRKLFEGLNISKNEYFEKQGNFPVISISFRNYDEENLESGFRTIKKEIKRGILNKQFTKYFGILENEVESALEDFELEYDLLDVQKWYNGYLTLTEEYNELKKILV